MQWACLPVLLLNPIGGNERKLNSDPQIKSKKVVEIKNQKSKRVMRQTGEEMYVLERDKFGSRKARNQ